MAEYKDVTLIMQEIEQEKHNLKFKNAEYAEVFSSALAFFQGVVDRVRAADVVEVVRCKDCKHYRNHPNGLCYAHTEPCGTRYKGETICVEPDDFCSCGERKDDKNVQP